MQALAYLASHQRRVQLVTGKQKLFIEAGEAECWEIGLMGLMLLHRHFRSFYDQHIGEQRITARLLLGATGAFYSLANDICPLQEPIFVDCGLSPEQWLTADRGDEAVALGELGEWSYFIRSPYPVLYGVGISAILDDHRGLDSVRLLTLALWHLFRGTSWGLGIDLADIMDTGGVDLWFAELVLLLKPLPGDTDVEHLLMCLQLPMKWQTDIDVPAEQIIAYAFARTHEELANVDTYDIDMVYGGQIAHDWEDLEMLGQNATESQALADAYEELAMIMERDIQSSFRELAELLHQTNRECKRRRWQARRKSTPLIETLTDDELEPINQEALADL